MMFWDNIYDVKKDRVNAYERLSRAWKHYSRRLVGAASGTDVNVTKNTAMGRTKVTRSPQVQGHATFSKKNQSGLFPFVTLDIWILTEKKIAHFVW